MRKIICTNCGEENQVEKEGMIYCKHCNQPLEVKPFQEKPIRPGTFVNTLLYLISFWVLVVAVIRMLDGSGLLALKLFGIAIAALGLANITTAINKVILKMDKLTK